MQLGRLIARTIAPLALATFIAAGCGGGDSGVLGFGGIADDAVCNVNGESIKKKEFDRLFNNAEQQYKDNGRDFPKKGSAEYKSLQSDLVEYLVQQQLIKGQADKYGLEATDKDIKKGVKELKQQVAQGDEKKFKSEMKRVNYTMAMVERDVEFDVISKKLYKRVVADIKITDKDAKDYYEENPDQFKTKKSREIAHILVKDKAKADSIYAQVKGGDEKLFAKLAKANTLDPSSKETGGVLPGGAVQQGQTVPEFDKAAFALDTGEVSPPVKTSYGWHVISARGDVKPESSKKFDDVKGDIKKQLKGEQQGERYQEWTTDIRKDAEDDVSCRKGYVWKQTVTETDKATTAPAEQPAPAEGDAEGGATEDAATEDAAAGDDAAADEDAPADEDKDADK
ncbi:MAG: putative rotamase, PpiC-type [Thermoleophilia bacterium]|nr:putative rotamase, PpiC-type [Thermoleophilia bacterium]